MLNICCCLAITPNADVSLSIGALWCDDGCIFLPFAAADFYAATAQLLVVAHSGIVNNVDI